MTPSSWSRSNNRLQRYYAVSLLLILSAIPNLLALEVVQGSNCTNSCLSTVTGYTTNGSDIVCHDSDYNRTVYGDTFQSCVSCEIQSEMFNRQTGQTNLGWALYNMRYALSWCLFEYPEPRNQLVSKTCATTCAPISNAIKTNILTPNATTPYDYCGDPNFLPNVHDCATCYKIIPNQLYISNFLSTLEWACQNQPAPVKPFYIKPDAIFTHNPPQNYSNITVPAPAAVSHGPSHSTKIALVISIPVGAFLILSLLFVWLFVSRHTNRAKDRRSYYNEKHISRSSANWNAPSRRGLDQARNGTDSPRPVPYPAPLNPHKVATPAPLRPQKSNSSIPFAKVFGSPMYDEHIPPLRPQNSNQSIPFLQPTRYSPPRSPPHLQPSKTSSKAFPFTTQSSKPPPSGPPSGLVSWERIAIQNARIRASQAPSPSPVSPLTKVQIVQIPHSNSRSRNASIPFRHDSPFRQNSPFQYDPPFRQDSLIPLSRQDSQPIFRRPSSSTLGTTYLQHRPSTTNKPPRRHRSNRSKRSSGSLLAEPQPPRRQGTPGQGEMLKEDAPPIPTPYNDPTESPMMPLSPIRPLSPILRSDTLRSTETLRPSALRPGSLRPETRHPATNTQPRAPTSTPQHTTTPPLRPSTPIPTQTQDRSPTLPSSTSTYQSYRSAPDRPSTPIPPTTTSSFDDDDDYPAPLRSSSGRSKNGGTTKAARRRSDSGKSKGSGRKVRWSKDVDYEDGYWKRRESGGGGGGDGAGGNRVGGWLSERGL